MTQLADSKLAALETLTGSTGTVQDLEAEYLVLLGATASRTIVDQWGEVFDNAAITAGQHNDRWMAYMDFILAPATQDHYNEREREYWDNGGTPIGPVGPSPPKQADLQLWFDLTDNSVVFADAAGTTPATNNSEVRRVNDKGTAGLDIIENTASVPDYATDNEIGLNCAGETTLSLNDLISATTGAAGITIAAVMQRQGFDGLTHDCFRWFGGPSILRIGADTSNNWQLQFSSGIGPITVKPTFVGEWLYIIGTINASTNNYIIRDGTNELTGTDDYTAFTPTNFDLAGLDGLVGEVLIYDVECSSSELDDIETYFNNKYGGLPQSFAPFQANLSHWWDFTDQSEVFADTAGLTPITDGTIIQRVNDKGLAGDDLEDASSGITWEDSVVNGHSVARNTVVQVPARFTSQALTTLIGFTGGLTYSSVARLFNVPGGQGILHAIDNGPSNVSFETGFGDWAEEHPNQGTTFSNKAVVPDEWVEHTMSDGGPSGYIQHVSGAVDVTAIANFAIQTGTPVEIFAQSVDGEIGEILVYDRGLTAAELLVLQAYYDVKYGTLPFIDLPVAGADLLHHIDFTDNFTVFKNPPATQFCQDGDPIRVVLNQGDDGTSLTSASTGVAPIYRTGVVNGLNIADFGPSGKVLDALIASGLTISTTGFAMAAIVRFNNSFAGLQTFFDWPGVSLNWTGLPVAGRAVIAGAGSFTLVPTPAAVTNWYLMYFNSDAVGADDALFGSPGPEIVGAVGPGFDIANATLLSLLSGTWDLEMAEIAFWDGPLTVSERADLVAYADAKYGVLPHA